MNKHVGSTVAAKAANLLGGNDGLPLEFTLWHDSPGDEEPPNANPVARELALAGIAIAGTLWRTCRCHFNCTFNSAVLPLMTSVA